MKELPEARTGATDMIFCLARTEIAKFIQKMNPSHPNWAQTWEVEDVEEKERHLVALEDEMEMKYLRYCDFANPVHQITSAMLRGAIMSGRLRIRLPRAKAMKELPEEERKKVWEISNKIIDYTNAAHDNLVFQRFMWHMQAFFQFDPLIWILNELRRNPLAHKDEQIWPKIEKVFIEHPGLIELKRSLHVAVARLTLKKWD